MADSTLSEAIKEAYASAPDDEIVYHTLEFRHPAFTQPIRVVRDYVNLTAALEAGAPLNGGEMVEFVAFAFELQLPEKTERGMPEISITIDNVSREILANVELALGSTSLIEVTYRAYLSSDLSAPQNTPPMSMVVRHIDAEGVQMAARAGFEDLAGAAVPRCPHGLIRVRGVGA